MRGIAPIFYSGRLVPVRYNLSIVSRSSFTLIELLVVTRLRPSDYGRASRHRGSFTLIELLVVIAIVAILSAVVIITLNPAELLKQSRDSNRLSDLNTLNKALALYEVDVVGGTLGATSTVYVSLPDTSATCANLGLPTLPVGYQYGCVTEANLRKTDGSGWIPVDLTQISSNTPLGSLPTDPVNATSSGLYYTYVPGGSYEVNGSMESNKYKMAGSSDKVSKDGGDATALFELGSNIRLNPIDYGDTSLIGWWNFEEGSGSSAGDGSGNGRTGTLTNGPSWTSGKAGGGIGLDGSNDHVSVPDNAAWYFGTDPFTISMWVRWNSLVDRESIIGQSSGPGNVIKWDLVGGMDTSFAYDSTKITLHIWNGSNYFASWAWTASSATWYHLAITRSGTDWILFVNGVQTGGTQTLSVTVPNVSSDLRIGSDGEAWNFLNGTMDDVRIYNRALSASEIGSVYNATQ